MFSKSCNTLSCVTVRINTYRYKMCTQKMVRGYSIMKLSSPSWGVLYSWPQKVSGHAIFGRCGWQTNVWITWQHLDINTLCNSKNHSYIYVDHVYKRNSALIMTQWSSIWKYKNWACLLVCSVSEEQVTLGLCFIHWYKSLQNPQSAQHYKCTRKNSLHVQDWHAYLPTNYFCAKITNFVLQWIVRGPNYSTDKCRVL